MHLQIRKFACNSFIPHLGICQKHLLDRFKYITLADSHGIVDSQSLLEMGTKDLNFVQLNQLIGRKTGGISVFPFTSSVRGKEEPCSRIIVRGKAMAARAEDLYDLVLLSFWNFSA